MVSRTNEVLHNSIPYPLAITTGTGTFGTAVTFDFAFSETPAIVITPTESPVTTIVLSSKSATGFTAHASATKAFTYQAIGLRE